MSALPVAVRLGPGVTGKGYAPHVTRWTALRCGGWLLVDVPAAHIVWRPFRYGVVIMWREARADRPRIRRVGFLRALTLLRSDRS